MPAIDDIMILRLACSKLCHDLISPVSAVNNGLELIGDTMAGDAEAMDLITSSARAAADRLQYYRVAFGFSGGSGQSPQALQTLLKPFVADAKCQSSWTVDPGVAHAVLSIDAAQIVLNAIAVGLDCLPRGGDVRVAMTPAPGGKLQLTIDVGGPSVRIRDEMRETLTRPLDEIELTVRGVQAILLRQVGARVGSDVALSSGEARVGLSIGPIPIGG
jgi:histidine phosphotransferase ChpT